MENSYLFPPNSSSVNQKDQNGDGNDFNDVSAPSLMTNSQKPYEYDGNNGTVPAMPNSPEALTFNFPSTQAFMGMEPHSAPITTTIPTMFPSALSSSPTFANSTPFASSIDDYQNQPTRPLTNAQKEALASVEASRSEYGSSLSLNGVDTQNMTADQLRSLATQMQSISSSTAAELRRQLHIHSEQKRRAQIRNGFDELRYEIPGCAEQKKMSKAMVLSRAIDFIRRLKHEREIMFSEMERLRMENEHLSGNLNQ